jgi:hypothetical protein
MQFYIRLYSYKSYTFHTFVHGHPLEVQQFCLHQAGLFQIQGGEILANKINVEKKSIELSATERKMFRPSRSREPHAPLRTPES